MLFDRAVLPGALPLFIACELALSVRLSDGGLGRRGLARIIQGHELGCADGLASGPKRSCNLVPHVYHGIYAGAEVYFQTHGVQRDGDCGEAQKKECRTECRAG
jgi:hypothetical protein